jgi:hypothetical protein
MKFLSAPCHAERGIQNISATLKIIGPGDRLEWGDPKRSPRYGDEGGTLAQGVAVWWMDGELLHGPRWGWKEGIARENFGSMPNEKALDCIAGGFADRRIENSQADFEFPECSS